MKEKKFKTRTFILKETQLPQLQVQQRVYFNLRHRQQQIKHSETLSNTQSVNLNLAQFNNSKTRHTLPAGHAMFITALLLLTTELPQSN